MSVLLGNMPLVNFIHHYIRDTSDIFSISSLGYCHYQVFARVFVNIIKIKLHVGLKI